MISVQRGFESLGMFRILAALSFLIVAISADAALADQPLGPVPNNTDMSARAVTTLLFRAKPGQRPDLSGKLLVYLDLSEIEFQRRQSRAFRFLRSRFHRRQPQRCRSFAHAARSVGADARRSLRRQSDGLRPFSGRRSMPTCRRTRSTRRASPARTSRKFTSRLNCRGRISGAPI